MHLLKALGAGDFSLEKFSTPIPRYAILSHTWADDEITFQVLKNSVGKPKVGNGWEKLKFLAKQSNCDDIEYFWADTCCIDKDSSAVLSEALNSMFRWYGESQRCYVYLSDVGGGLGWEQQFRTSRWFTRGWTLQELIAPQSVEFFSKEGKLLGDKASLEHLIHEITDIPKEALRSRPLSTFSLDQRMKWSANRNTTLEEDKAYCLLGLFNVTLPVIYGEGQKRAMERLHQEVISSSSVMKVEVARWLSPFDFIAKQRELHRLWTPNTCQWFLESEEFLTWSSESVGSDRTHQALWCSGSRKCQVHYFHQIANKVLEGTGKSVLRKVGHPSL